jgi:protein gp37
MADHTPIEWTDATWNIVTGCSLVSPGCTNCYAMKLAGTRLRDHPSRQGLTADSKAGPVWNGQVRFNAQWLDQPLRWTKPRKIFVCAHGDLFHEGVEMHWLDQIFAVMALCPQHVFQILTKRPERMRAYLQGRPHSRWLDAIRRIQPPAEGQGVILSTTNGVLPNVWLGVSVEDQARADERIPVLLDTPAAVRWISAEPLLGPVDLQHIEVEAPGRTFRNALTGAGLGRTDGPFVPLADLESRLDWVVVGGESGPGARPMHPDWARALRDQCAGAEVPFLFKQWGDWTPGENAQSTIGRTVETADWFNDQWHFESLTPASAEGMHIDDEPTCYRAGKKAAGRRLDGVLHDAYPEVRA